MNTIKNTIKNVFSYSDFLLMILLGIYVIIMTICSPITITQGCSFYLYQLFSVFLPGVAIYQLLHIPGADALERSLFGYSFGYVWGILQYLFFFGLKIDSLIRPFQPVFAIIAISYLFYCAKSKEPVPMKGNIGKIKSELLLFSVFLSLVIGMRFVTYYGLNLLPTETLDVTFPTQDILFYIGNAVSAQKGFPLEEFRFAGASFKYHYFGSLHLAMSSIITNIAALELEFCLQWISSSIMLLSSFYCLMRRLKLTTKMRIIGLFILLFTTGKELIVYVAYQHIMYKALWGFDLGLVFGIFTTTLLYIQHQEKKLHWGLLAGCLLTFFACEGSKAPIAVVILFLAGCVCGLWLLNASQKKWAFIYGIPLVFLFLVVFFIFVSEGMNTVTTNATGLRFSLTGHLYECGLGKMYFQWTEAGFPQLPGKILIFTLFFFGCNPITYFMLTVQTCRLLKQGFRRILCFEGCMLATTCLGLAFTLFSKQQGNSQMYFAMTSFPLATIGFLAMENKLENINGKLKKILLNTCFLVLFCFSIINYIEILSSTVWEGLEKMQGINTFSQESNSLSYKEKEAYEWIRDNTPEDSLCVANLIMEDNQYQSFIVGVCTERQLYMEGWRYVAGYISEAEIFQRRDCIDLFFNGSTEAYQDIQNAGVDYAIWVKRYSAQKEWSTPIGNKIFENEAVAVYDLNN